MRGTIQRRGKSSWRLKFDVARVRGERVTRYVTVRGKRAEAEAALARLLNDTHNGTLVDPSKLTVGDHVREWLDSAHDITPKTAERYRQLAEQQIIPHLGGIVLQKLRPADVKRWHATILKQGGENGRPLSSRTVGHAHRVLHRALQSAVEVEALPRNVASAVKPPKVNSAEIEILMPHQVADVLAKLDGHALFPIVALALATGMRRGELIGLRWSSVDLDKARVKVERTVEETKVGLRVKSPKTKNGRRTIDLPKSAVELLRAHRRQQLETRLALGQGKIDAEALVFCKLDGSTLSPDNLSRDWRRIVRSRKLPPVSFHSLRHCHASALIASGLDVLSISRRLGHASPSITLTIYGHLFTDKGREAAAAIEAVLGSYERKV